MRAVWGQRHQEGPLAARSALRGIVRGWAGPCHTPSHRHALQSGTGCSFKDGAPACWTLCETYEEAHVPQGPLCPGVHLTSECGSLGPTPGKGVYLARFSHKVKQAAVGAPRKSNVFRGTARRERVRECVRLGERGHGQQSDACAVRAGRPWEDIRGTGNHGDLWGVHLGVRGQDVVRGWLPVSLSDRLGPCIPTERSPDTWGACACETWPSRTAVCLRVRCPHGPKDPV